MVVTVFPSDEEVLGVKKIYSDDICTRVLLDSLRRCLIFRDGGVVMEISRQKLFSSVSSNLIPSLGLSLFF